MTVPIRSGRRACWTCSAVPVRARRSFRSRSRAAAHPELIARILADGHADRAALRRARPPLASARSRGAGGTPPARCDLLASVGVRPTLWRTPWGDTAPWSAQVARGAIGLRIVGWTVDTHDWRGDTAGEMLRATSDDLRDGAIVLAHDGIGPGARRADCARDDRVRRARVAEHAVAAGLELGTAA